MKYELFCLIGASKETELEKIRTDISEIVTSLGGVFEEKETIDKRRMAYIVKHETHGIYIARRFEAPPEAINEINKKINLYPGLLRFLISRSDELPELRSKEERISDAARRARPSREAKPVETPKRPELKPKAEKPATPAEQADIDKKLEEILNI